MSAFARHGIKHLSASSLACYRNEPSLWVLRYLYGVKDEGGAKMWRGSAVERGVDLILYENASDDDAINAALEYFDTQAMGEVSDEIMAERAAIPDFVRKAGETMRPYGIPSARQFKIETWLDGIEVPVIGYVDYLWPDFLVDLKTTWKLPSEARPDHIAQVAIYAKAKERKPYLVYVTPKKADPKAITGEQLKDAMWAVQKSAHAVRALLSVAATKEEAATLFCPNLDHWMWNDASKEAALAVWR